MKGIQRLSYGFLCKICNVDDILEWYQSLRASLWGVFDFEGQEWILPFKIEFLENMEKYAVKATDWMQWHLNVVVSSGMKWLEINIQ